MQKNKFRGGTSVHYSYINCDLSNYKTQQMHNSYIFCTQNFVHKYNIL